MTSVNQRGSVGPIEASAETAPERRVAERVRELARSYEPPGFAHVPNADAALFLCAIDHRTGYGRAHRVAGEGPYSGSELLWELACRRERGAPGTLRAAALGDCGEREVAELFEVEGETVSGPGERAWLWRDLAAGLARDHGGSALGLIAACGGRLGGPRGLIERMRRYVAYADPLAKKSFLFAKIAERRGWLEVADPGAWEVCADNVLMRLALRSGLVEPGPTEQVRAATRAAFRRVADLSGVAPPILDDLLWELGRDDPDLIGAGAGDLREPPRIEGRHWY